MGIFNTIVDKYKATKQKSLNKKELNFWNQLSKEMKALA